MCLAEALLRIPDGETADELIADKLLEADWSSHLNRSDSLFVNASTFGLMLTGRMIEPSDLSEGRIRRVWQGLVRRSTEPVVRQAVRQAMRILGHQFVLGRDIDEALQRAARNPAYRYSFDMLGEAARTAADARRYLAAYLAAVETLSASEGAGDPVSGPGISVKLSALHPRFETARREQVLEELGDSLLEIARAAREARLGMTVDAEEAARWELTLELFERVLADPALAGWEGFGIAVQCYQRRGLKSLEVLAGMARRHRRRLMVRLVKGAYWDSEIKLAQVQGLDDYPVFTRKASSDVAYQAGARYLLEQRDLFYPQFATHNAYAVAAVLELAGDREGFEFQRLHGMGEALYDHLLADEAMRAPVRVYAPVGGHAELLSYLVRRLLENGANNSFVNRLVDDATPVEEIIADPVARMRALGSKRHPHIPLPADIFRPSRRNSRGLDLSDTRALERLDAELGRAGAGEWRAAPTAASERPRSAPEPVVSPHDHGMAVGAVHEAAPEEIAASLARGAEAFEEWAATPVAERADLLRRTADLLEANRAQLMAMCVREAGRTLPDALSEVREAVDFLRYYAVEAERLMGEPQVLQGYTGEHNELQLHGCGLFACISPWNFPLAIFTGQVAAALAAGNAVIAKPAEQTPLVAARAVSLFHQAGLPRRVLQLLPGRGETVGAALVRDPRVAGVAFTGSLEVAQRINRSLAEREGPIGRLVAETGGQNAMIVDSSALVEQTVEDVIVSAFNSAGQRCSALRVLYLQEETADRFLEILVGALEQLVIGDPMRLETDVGPVIDDGALAGLEAHAERMGREARLVHRPDLPAECAKGSFFAPQVFELESIRQLDREVFGPVLHVIRYRAQELDAVIDEINGTGYGLTFGIQSRIEHRWREIQRRARAGNAYVNRNMIGAVVGVQPFGGEGLSGTGPKAGGPYTLLRFVNERTLTVNITATGGNASLLTLPESE